ncbi:MAG: DUF937 domain-containing protein [Spirosomataceae bacterium]
MIEVLQQLVQQVSQKVVVENPAIPNALNTQTVELLSGNLVQELTQKAGSVEGIQQIAGLLGSNASNISSTNPLISSMIEKIAPTLTQTLNISPTAAQSVVESLVPTVMSLLSSKVADPNDSSVSIESVVKNLAGNTDISSIMGQIGSIFSDGKLDMKDVKGIAEKGGLGDLLGGFFGK